MPTVTTFVLCGWCHTMCPATQAYCPTCGHQPGIARMHCACPKCWAAKINAVARPWEHRNPNPQEPGKL